MRPKRILVVDDCAQDRERLKELAQSSAGPDASVDTVATFEKAVSAVGRTAYDLILLDDDLGAGTNAFISVVTLRAAGHANAIVVAGSTLWDKRRDELSRAGVTEYHIKADLTSCIVERALAA